MMSKKKFFVLVVIYVGYMLIGALIFYKIEVPWEIARREVEREERREIEGERKVMDFLLIEMRRSLTFM